MAMNRDSRAARRPARPDGPMAAAGLAVVAIAGAAVGVAILTGVLYGLLALGLLP